MMKLNKFIFCTILSAYLCLELTEGLLPNWKGCVEPPMNRVTNFAWDQSKEVSGGYYFPISSTSDKLIELQMLGADATKCVRMRWSDDSITVNIFYGVGGYGSEQEYFRCVQTEPPKNMWECEHLRAKGVKTDLSHKAWITLTDNQTYSFTVRCFPNIKKQGWVLFSTMDKLSPSLQSKVLNHRLRHYTERLCNSSI